MPVTLTALIYKASSELVHKQVEKKERAYRLSGQMGTEIPGLQQIKINNDTMIRNTEAIAKANLLR